MNGELFWFSNWDRGMFEALNKWFSSIFFDALMPVISDLTVWAIPAAIVWFWFFVKTDRRGKMIALCCFLVVAATDQLSSTVLKPYVARSRPCNVVPEARLYQNGNWITTDKYALTTYKTSYSFPSSHAANIAGMATFWSYFYPHATPVMLVATFFVGYSRIYLGEHYPSDVVAGYLLGILVAILIAYPLRVWVLPPEDE